MNNRSRSAFHLNPTTDLRLPIMLAKYPVFAMAPGVTSCHFTFRENGVGYFICTSSEETGRLPTLVDSDPIIYFASYLTKQKNLGIELEPCIPFCAADFLRLLGRSPGGQQTRLLDVSIERLRGTHINSNYSAAGCRPPRIETLITHVERTSRTRRITAIWVGEWFLDQIRHHRIIKIGPEAIRLRGLARRIHGWTVHVPNAPNARWEISLDMAYFKAGGDRQPQARGDFRKFQYALKQLAVKNPLSGFRIDVDPARQMFSIERLSPQVEEARPKPSAPLYVDFGDEPKVECEPIVLDCFDG